VRVRHEGLKGQKITIGGGAIVQVDKDGIFEVDAQEADRLFTIPGYEKA
jgi:hypothetical protein